MPKASWRGSSLVLPASGAPHVLRVGPQCEPRPLSSHGPLLHVCECLQPGRPRLETLHCISSAKPKQGHVHRCRGEKVHPKTLRVTTVRTGPTSASPPPPPSPPGRHGAVARPEGSAAFWFWEPWKPQPWGLSPVTEWDPVWGLCDTHLAPRRWSRRLASCEGRFYPRVSIQPSRVHPGPRPEGGRAGSHTSRTCRTCSQRSRRSRGSLGASGPSVPAGLAQTVGTPHPLWED